MEIYLLCTPMFHRTLLIVHRLLVFLVWKRIIIVMMVVYQCKEQKESCLFIFLCYIFEKELNFYCMFNVMTTTQLSFACRAPFYVMHIQVHERIHELITELQQISREDVDMFISLCNRNEFNPLFLWWIETVGTKPLLLLFVMWRLPCNFRFLWGYFVQNLIFRGKSSFWGHFQPSTKFLIDLPEELF